MDDKTTRKRTWLAILTICSETKDFSETVPDRVSSACHKEQVCEHENMTAKRLNDVYPTDAQTRSDSVKLSITRARGKLQSLYVYEHLL